MKLTDITDFLYVDYICRRCNYTTLHARMTKKATMGDVLQNIVDEKKSCYICRDGEAPEMSIIRVTLDLDEGPKRRCITKWYCPKCHTSWISYENRMPTQDLENTTCCPNPHCLNQEGIFITSMKKET